MLSIAKLRNLKAIHNRAGHSKTKNRVVINHKTTKFESNSQREVHQRAKAVGCYQSQNYKIWKQFTTQRRRYCSPLRLLSITKLQNLKAIHNLIAELFTHKTVVINHKTTKFESNSQQPKRQSRHVSGCYQSQNYKIWKQFTTGVPLLPNRCRLLSITKLQNLKAIHNLNLGHLNLKGVVINHKTTEFESNSQLNELEALWHFGCYQSQNYKIWKQFTTHKRRVLRQVQLLSIAKLQNLKAIHNSRRCSSALSSVVINRKTTKFESNSQLQLFCVFFLYCCYQSQKYKIWKQFTKCISK